MSFFTKLFGRKVSPPPPGGLPFMEHPTGKFPSALKAITWAMQRLQPYDFGDRWITFSGQGQGATPDDIEFADVPYQNRTFDLRGQTLDIAALMDSAHLDALRLTVTVDEHGYVNLPNATPDELARFLDTVFQQHFSIKPFDGDGDYSVGAEW